MTRQLLLEARGNYHYTITTREATALQGAGQPINVREVSDGEEIVARLWGTTRGYIAGQPSEYRLIWATWDVLRARGVEVYPGGVTEHGMDHQAFDTLGQARKYLETASRHILREIPVATPAAVPAPATHSEIRNWPPVVVLGDDLLVDLVDDRLADGTALLLLTNAAAEVAATVRLTPTAAHALVSALLDHASRAPGVTDRLWEMLENTDTTTTQDDDEEHQP